MDATFVLRPDKGLASPSLDSPPFQPPSTKELLGQWYIIHTSLPFWRDKRNVRIAYSAPSSSDTSTDVINDSITFQTSKSEKLRTLQGVNTVAPGEQQGNWSWRGSGWVKVATNNWEVLAHGPRHEGEVPWIVIFTRKSLLTPAAIHIYSRYKEQISLETLGTLTTTLGQSPIFKGLVESMFQVPHD